MQLLSFFAARLGDELIAGSPACQAYDGVIGAGVPIHRYLHMLVCMSQQGCI